MSEVSISIAPKGRPTKPQSFTVDGDGGSYEVTVTPKSLSTLQVHTISVFDYVTAKAKSYMRTGPRKPWSPSGTPLHLLP